MNGPFTFSGHPRDFRVTGSAPTSGEGDPVLLPLPQPGNDDASYATVPALLRARTMDAPLFCLSIPSALITARKFVEGFPGITTYAVKACPLPDLIRTFYLAGISAFDVASPAEMELVRAASPDAVLHYNNPIRSLQETVTAWTAYGVRHYAIDDGVGLSRLREVIPPREREDVEVAVRVRTERNAAHIDFTAKFGIPAAQAGNLLAAVDKAGFKAAITFHPGSQCDDPQAYADLIRSAGEIVRKTGIHLSTLNVGGGFPVFYDNSDCPPPEAYFQVIRDTYEAAFEDAKPRLVAEPGRALAAPTMSLLTSVKHIRADGTLFLNDGMYGGLLELTQVDLHLPLRVWRGSELLTGPAKAFCVYGPTCCPLDRYPNRLALPQSIEEGDVVEFGLTGAYGIATVTRFNGYGPGEVVHVDEILGARHLPA